MLLRAEAPLMPIVPSGDPLWARNRTLEEIGGNLEKQDYLGRGPIDQIVDVGADQFARLTADLVAISRTAPFCAMTITCDDTSAMPLRTDPDYAIRIQRYRKPAVQLVFGPGARVAPYWQTAPGMPTVTRVGDGSVTITFASEYSDAYGVSAPFEITSMTPGKAVSNDAKACVTCAIDPGRLSVTLSAKTSAGAAIQDAMITGVQFW
jgi:hypothetical protein